jgi:hypothetical protein
VRPGAAFFGEALGEFLLPYAAVRDDADPDASVLAFLQSTYEAAANAGGWDRAQLECALGRPGPLTQVGDISGNISNLPRPTPISD